MKFFISLICPKCKVTHMHVKVTELVFNTYLTNGKIVLTTPNGKYVDSEQTCDSCVTGNIFSIKEYDNEN